MVGYSWSFARVFRIFYCAKSIAANAARARNWCNNAVTYGQTAAKKKRVARNDQTAEVRRRRRSCEERCLDARAFCCIHNETFFHVLIEWVHSCTVKRYYWRIQRTCRLSFSSHIRPRITLLSWNTNYNI